MSRTSRWESALQVNDDPEDYARVLSSLHHARMEGHRLPARPRPIIERSWDRMQRMGKPVEAPDPDVDEEAASQYRDGKLTFYGATAADLTAMTQSLLEPLLAGSGLIGVFSSDDARVSVRYGDAPPLRRADRIGFVPGARWNEGTAGTNAIGIATRLNVPVQVHGPEHWCLTQHTWSCAASPLRDPATGGILGVLDVSGPVPEAHPAILGFVSSVTGQLEMWLQNQHLRYLDQLRTRCLGMLPSLSGRWILCDRMGWVIGFRGVTPQRRLDLPGKKTAHASCMNVPGVGVCTVTVLDDVVIVTPEDAPPEYTLHVDGQTVEMHVAGSSTSQHISAKHAAILKALQDAGRPLEPGQIAASVWEGQSVSDVTVRAEVSRLRRRFPGLISSAPYGLLAPLTVTQDA